MFVHSSQDVPVSLLPVSLHNLGDAQSIAVFDTAFDECGSHQQVVWM